MGKGSGVASRNGAATTRPETTTRERPPVILAGGGGGEACFQGIVGVRGLFGPITPTYGMRSRHAPGAYINSVPEQGKANATRGRMPRRRL